jgi:hypothetical protein
MTKKIQISKINIRKLLVFIILSGCFTFFAYFYKYHLFFIEQMQLFILTWEHFLSYFTKPAAISSYLGDFFTQFYYLKGGGAIIITISLALIWYLFHKLLYRYGNANWLFYLPPLIVIIVAMLHCDIGYPLASTISLIFAIASNLSYTYIKNINIRLLVGILFIPILYIIAGGYFTLFVIGSIGFELKKSETKKWKFISFSALCIAITFFLPVKLRSYYCLTLKQEFLYPNIEKIIPQPNFFLEKLLSLDCEWYFNHPEKTLELAKKYELKSKYAFYYYNLAQSYYYHLPDGLMDYLQPGSSGLFIPLNAAQNYMTIAFSNEVYYLLGDVNASQHCALLSVTYSPKGQSSRMLRRLVEINIINGEYAAAEKYIKMLEKTWFHSKWAKEMRQYLYKEDICNKTEWIMLKRMQIPTTDFIKENPNDYVGTLNHLIKDHPQNKTTLDYLLCFYLLNKDLTSFYQVIIEKIKSNQIVGLPALYQQALLIYFVKNPHDKNRDIVKFSSKIFNQFVDYTNVFAANKGNGKPLESEYGRTYWFYYHYAQLNNAFTK